MILVPDHVLQSASGTKPNLTMFPTGGDQGRKDRIKRNSSNWKNNQSSYL